MMANVRMRVSPGDTRANLDERGRPFLLETEDLDPVAEFVPVDPEEASGLGLVPIGLVERLHDEFLLNIMHEPFEVNAFPGERVPERRIEAVGEPVPAGHLGIPQREMAEL